MIVAVFGATGRTGRHIVDQGLNEGHEIAALVRDTEKVDWADPRLRLVEGDARVYEDVERAVKGADAVLSVLAPPENKPGKPITKATENIVRAMRARGVRRLVASTGSGVAFPQDRPKALNKVIGWMVRTLSKYVYEDMQGAAERVVQSDLSWTLVRVPVLYDGPPTAQIRVGYVGRGAGARLTRADLANFMLELLEDEKYVHDVPVISN